MPETTGRWTADMVRELPADGNRYEVIDGALQVTPAPQPRHQMVVFRLQRALDEYLERHAIPAVAFGLPGDISWDDANLVQPDIFVVPRQEVTNDWRTYRTLWLAVEVLSPSSGRADRLLKRRLYQRQRVGAYWIVDVAAAVVEVWLPDDERPAIVSGMLSWQASAAAPPLHIELNALFHGLPE